MVEVIVLGPPGTGKGTVAQFIEENFPLRHIASGDLLREEVRNGTDIGKKVAPVMKEGKLVNDEVVSKLLVDKIKREKEDFVLDGYPRKMTQTKILGRVMDSMNKKIDLVIEISTDEKTIIKRLSARRQCENCGKIYGLDFPPKREGICDKCGGRLFQRDDDKPEIIKKRLGIYNKRMSPVIEFYREKGILVELDGNQNLESMLEETKKIVKENFREVV